MNQENQESKTLIEESVQYAIKLMKSNNKSPEMVAAIAELLKAIQEWE